MTEIEELLAKLKELDPETWEKYDESSQHYNVYLDFYREYILQGVIQNAMAAKDRKSVV